MFRIYSLYGNSNKVTAINNIARLYVRTNLDEHSAKRHAFAIRHTRKPYISFLSCRSISRCN